MSNYSPILPSSLLSEHGEEENGTFNHEFANFGLKTGVIIRTYEMDHKENVLKLGPEYDVVIHEQDANRATTSVIYKNCQFMEQFGGIGDFLDVKRREPTNTKYKTEYDILKFDGSLVLMMCANGIANKGIIIGALTNPNRKSTLTKAAGNHLEGQFNGLNWQINKDGALTVTFKSATDNKGKPRNKAAGGTKLSINKAGTFEITDGLMSKIKLDKETQDITIEAGMNIKQSSIGDTVMSVGGNASVTASNYAVNVAQGSATQKSLKWVVDVLGSTEINTTMMEIKAKAKMDLSAPIMNLKAAGMMKIEAPIIMLGGSGAMPTVKAFELVVMGIGNLGAPVISNCIAGMTTVVLVK